MSNNDITTVLANWLREARSSGQLASDVDEADWVSQRFAQWFHSEVSESIKSVQLFSDRINAELRRLGGWDNKDLVEAMEDSRHLSEALDDLWGLLGLAKQQEE